MFFEDYEIGQVFDEEIEDVIFSEEEIIEASEKYDPRDIHVDKKAARESRFGELIAPGAYANLVLWAAWVRTGIDRDGVIAGTAVLSCKWLRPVLANVRYKVKVEIVGKNKREGKDKGLVDFKMTAANPQGEIVTEYIAQALVRSRDNV